MVDIYVPRDCHSRITRVAERDKWDRDDTYCDWQIADYIELHEDSKSWSREVDLSVPFEVTSGIKYYLLYGVYSTGDSFGHDENSGIEFCGLFTDKHVAEQNDTRLRVHYDWAKYSGYRIGKRQPNAPKYADGQWTVKLLSDDGMSEFMCGVPWTGYFESLSYTEVKEVQLALKLHEV